MTSVTALPTAAQQRVRQFRNQSTRRAMVALRASHAQRFRYRGPLERDAEIIARWLRPMTPERWELFEHVAAAAERRPDNVGRYSDVNSFERALISFARAPLGLRLRIMEALAGPLP